MVLISFFVGFSFGCVIGFLYYLYRESRDSHDTKKVNNHDKN